MKEVPVELDEEKNLREFELFLNSLREKQQPSQQQRSVSEANLSGTTSKPVPNNTLKSGESLKMATTTSQTIESSKSQVTGMSRKTFKQPSSTQTINVSPNNRASIIPHVKPNLASDEESTSSPGARNKRLFDDTTSLLKAANTPTATTSAQNGEQEATSETTSDYYSSAANHQPVASGGGVDERAELRSKLIDLAENEKKLKELYSLQSRLEGLRKIMSDFNILKSDDRGSNERGTEASPEGRLRVLEKNSTLLRELEACGFESKCAQTVHDPTIEDQTEDEQQQDEDDNDEDDDDEDGEEYDENDLVNGDDECILEIKKDSLDLEEEKR